MSIFRKKENIGIERFANERASCELFVHANLNQANFNNIYLRCSLHERFDCRDCIVFDDGWRPEQKPLLHHSFWGYVLLPGFITPDISVAPVTGSPNYYIVQPTDAFGSISLTLFTVPFVPPTTPQPYYYYTVIGDPGFTLSSSNIFNVGQSFVLSGLQNNIQFSNINSANTWYVANSSTVTGVYNFSPLTLSEFYIGDNIEISQPMGGSTPTTVCSTTYGFIVKIVMLNDALRTWSLEMTDLSTYGRYQPMIIRGCPPGCRNDHHDKYNMKRKNGFVSAGFERAQFLMHNANEELLEENKHQQILKEEQQYSTSTKNDASLLGNFFNVKPFSIENPFKMLDILGNL